MNKLFLSLAALSLSVASFGAEPFITFRPDAGSLPLVRAGKPLPILSDEQEAGIRMALESLSADFARVTGTRTPCVSSWAAWSRPSSGNSSKTRNSTKRC